MKISLVGLVISLLVCGCASVASYNAKLNRPCSVPKLKSDVDYVRRKLEKLHPSLYQYISKQELDNKFDSLTTSLVVPMTSKEFFFRLSPVVASIRQGHTRLFPPVPRLTNLDMAKVSRNGASPLTKLHLAWIDHRLFLTQKTAVDSTLKKGTEFLSIDTVSPQQLYAKYAPTFASDGFNVTFHDGVFNKKFTSYFYFEKGLRDSLLCSVAYQGNIRTIWLKNGVSPKKQKSKKKASIVAQKAQKTLARAKRIQGYDTATKMFSKSLRFEKPDSSVAILTIRDFTRGKYRNFYSHSFRQIDSVKAKALVIDLRDNTGGDLSDVQCLYGYLAERSFRFVKPALVTSKTSLWHDNHFKAESPVQFSLKLLTAPAWLVYNSIGSVITHKHADSCYYLHYPPIWKKHPRSNRFKGRIYVLINGCSFSASSIIAANLKGSGRALFVGEESGGAYNGCVAGQMPVFTLPGSKLRLSFGLLGVETPYKCIPDGRGVMPDVEMKPALNDRLSGKDPELQWVLDDVDRK